MTMDEAYEQGDLFPDSLPPINPCDAARSSDPNMMVRRFGYGPEGATCKTCAHLTRKKGKWIKCAIRARMAERQHQFTYSGDHYGGDHVAKWNACSEYVCTDGGGEVE